MCARNSLLLEMQFWYKTALPLLSRANSSYISISEGLVFLLEMKGHIVTVVHTSLSK